MTWSSVSRLPLLKISYVRRTIALFCSDMIWLLLLTVLARLAVYCAQSASFAPTRQPITPGVPLSWDTVPTCRGHLLAHRAGEHVAQRIRVGRIAHPACRDFDVRCL